PEKFLLIQIGKGIYRYPDTPGTRVWFTFGIPIIELGQTTTNGTECANLPTWQCIYLGLKGIYPALNCRNGIFFRPLFGLKFVMGLRKRDLGDHDHSQCKYNFPHNSPI